MILLAQSGGKPSNHEFFIGMEETELQQQQDTQDNAHQSDYGKSNNRVFMQSEQAHEQAHKQAGKAEQSPPLQDDR